VSHAELPEGVTCALTADGHLGHEDRWQVERFRRFLRESKALKAQYAPALENLAETDPDYQYLWGQYTEKLTALLAAYEAEEYPEPDDGDDGTCATCGGGIRYQACPTGGWWIHETHPADHHDARWGAPA
jgi:hypothetical protein